MYSGPVKTFKGGNKDTTVSKYFGDGSGRDGYVIKDSGGQIPEYASHSPQAKFLGSLRKYEQQTCGGNGSLQNKFFNVDPNGRSNREMSQPWFSEKIKLILQETFSKQQEESGRLATPKSVRPKFRNNSSSL